MIHHFHETRSDSLRKKGEGREALEGSGWNRSSVSRIELLLSGSMAQGTVDSWRDLDLLIMLPGGKAKSGWISSVDMLVFSQDDFERMLPESTFLQEIGKGAL